MSPPESLTTICDGFAGSPWPHATRGNAATMPPSASSERRVRWNLVIAGSSSLLNIYQGTSREGPLPRGVFSRSRQPAALEAVVRGQRHTRWAGEQMLRDFLGRRLRQPVDVR